MSEFTVGHIIQRNHSDLLADFNPVFSGHLNEKWTVFFTKDTDLGEEYPIALKHMSYTMPILHFYNFEDHGWGYEIISDGISQAKFELNYELEEMMLYELVEERYPQESPVDVLYMNSMFAHVRQELLIEVHSSSVYQDKLSRLFELCHVEKFSLFEVEEAQIEQLRKLMTQESLNSLSFHHDLVEQFKNILNLQKMSWIRPDRIEEYEEFDLEL